MPPEPEAPPVVSSPPPEPEVRYEDLTPEQQLCTKNTLSIREAEVALLLGRGDSNREISIALGLSIKTIDTHRMHVLKKLGLKGNVALVKYLIREGHVTP